MEMIARRVLRISANDPPQVLDWLQSTLRHALIEYTASNRNSWQAADLLHVMMLQANQFQPLPQVQIQYMDPYTGGFARIALWAALRATGNGRMDVLIGGDDEIDCAPWLLARLATLVQECFEYVEIDTESGLMPKYIANDKPINWDKGSSPIAAGSSGSLRNFDGQPLMVSRPPIEQLASMVDKLAGEMTLEQKAEARLKARGLRITDKRLATEMLDMQIEELMADYDAAVIARKLERPAETIKTRIKKLKGRNSP